MKKDIELIFITKLDRKYGAQNHVISYVDYIANNRSDLSSCYLVSFSDCIYDLTLALDAGLKLINVSTLEGFYLFFNLVAKRTSTIKLESHSALAGLISGILSRVFNHIIHIHHVHGSFLNKFNSTVVQGYLRRCFILIEKFLWKGSLLLFCSEEDLSYYRSLGFDKRRLFRFKYYISSTRSTGLKEKNTKGLIKFVFVAGFRKQKNQKEFVNCVLNAPEISAEFHFFGDGPEKESIEDKVLQSDDERFFFHGFRSPEYLNEFIAKNRCIGVLLSFYEGQPLALIEYLSNGLPIIVNAYSGTQELFKYDVGTLLPLSFEQNDILKAVDGYSKLDLIEYNRLSKNSRSCYLDNFSFEASIVEYVKLIDEI